MGCQESPERLEALVAEVVEQQEMDRTRGYFQSQTPPQLTPAPSMVGWLLRCSWIGRIDTGLLLLVWRYQRLPRRAPVPRCSPASRSPCAGTTAPGTRCPRPESALIRPPPPRCAFAVPGITGGSTTSIPLDDLCEGRDPHRVKPVVAAEVGEYLRRTRAGPAVANARTLRRLVRRTGSSGMPDRATPPRPPGCRECRTAP